MSLKNRSLVLVLFLFVTSCAPSSAQRSAADCLLQVDGPRSGQEVGKGVTVEGTATLAPGLHVWVFARRASYRDLQLWWPQGEGLVDPATRRWKVPATIGTPQDLGAEFDIAVAALALEQHLQARERYKKMLTSESSPPSEMPTPACPPVILVVKKTSPD